MTTIFIQQIQGRYRTLKLDLAQTGTGKTAAFILPILNRLVGSKYGCVRALIIAPTRELAEQIHQAIETLGRKTRIRSVTVYSGVGINPQIQIPDTPPGSTGRLSRQDISDSGGHRYRCSQWTGKPKKRGSHLNY
jgi:Lhr-like helicase